MTIAFELIIRIQVKFRLDYHLNKVQPGVTYLKEL